MTVMKNTGSNFCFYWPVVRARRSYGVPNTYYNDNKR